MYSYFFFFSFFGTTTVVGQGLPVPLVALLLATHSRIISPTYGGTLDSGLESMTGTLLGRTS